MPLAGTLSIEFLNCTNPAYSAYRCHEAEAMYRGGEHFDQLKGTMLDRRMADDDQRYRKSREQIGRYNNYVAGIFDNYISTAFTSAPTIVFRIAGDADIDGRAADGFLDYYNGLNEGLLDLLHGRCRDMILHGYGLLTCSFPDDDTPAANLLQQKTRTRALDAYFCYLHPADVEDWRMDLEGNLLWIKTHTVELVRSEEYGPCDQELHTWTYHTQEAKTAYQATKKIGHEWNPKTDVGTRVAERPNPLGMPIFECSLADRLCLFERIKRPAIALYNYQADWAWAIKAQCYGQPWYKGDKAIGELSTKAGEFNMWHLGSKDSDVGYLIPPDVAFASIKDLCKEQQDALFVTMNSQALDLSDRDQHAASGDAKAIDRVPAEAIASAYARRLRECLCDALDYVIATRKDQGLIEYKVLGLDVFSPMALSSQIADVTAFKALQASPTATKIAVGNLAQTMAADATPEEREAIESERDAVSIAPPAAPGAGPAKPGKPQAQSGAPGDGQPSGLDGDPKVRAPIKKIDSRKIIQLHDVDPDFKEELKDSMRKDGYDDDFPVLSVAMDSVGKGASLILDGHHRSASAKDLSLKIPSYQITEEQYRGILLARFGGVQPDKLRELDPYIWVVPPGQTRPVPYTQVRVQNDHDNGPTIGADGAGGSA